MPLWSYPHFRKKPKIPEPASKEDITKLIKKVELATKIRLLSARDRHKLLNQLRKEGRI